MKRPFCASITSRDLHTPFPRRGFFTQPPKIMKQSVFLLFFSTLLFLCMLTATTWSAEKKQPLPSQTQQKEAVYSSVEERRLLMSLQQERQNLDQERQQLTERKKELKRLEAEVDKKLDRLKELRLRIEKLLAEKSEAEQKRLQELSKIYAKMSPEKAARILISPKQDLAIAILDNMKVKSAARILNNMDKDTAARLSTAFSRLESSSRE